MSLAQDIQLQGWAAQAQVSADVFTVLGTVWTTFSGILDPQPGVDPRLDLGSDIRELAVIQVLNDDLPANVTSQIRLQQTIPPVPPNFAPSVATWRVIRRDANPGDITTKLWVCKVLPGQDQ